jgi:hypothetical protein
MGPVLTILGYLLFAAATLTGAVLVHSDWQQYAAAREAGQMQKPMRKVVYAR